MDMMNMGTLDAHHAGGTTGGNTGSMYGPNSDNPTGPSPEYGFHFGYDPTADYSNPISFLGLARNGAGFGIHGTGVDKLKQQGLDFTKDTWSDIKKAAPTGGAIKNIGSFFGGLFEDGGVRHQEGGMYDKMHQYQTGGQQLPGGQMQPIPGSDAVQFNGRSHDQGGIMLDSKTEVEGGETMDKVNGKDYFFSSYLKEGGRSYADMHKQILEGGGDQEKIDWLAKLQEKAAGRNPANIQTARHGGIKKYQGGGDIDFNPLKDLDGDGIIDGNDDDMDGDGIPNYIDSNPKEAAKEAATENKNKEQYFPSLTNKETNKETTETQGNTVGRNNKYKVASYETYGDEEGTYGDIPDYQPGYKVGDVQMYAGKDDAAFRKSLQEEDFRGEWMNNADPEVLEKAGITSFQDMNDPAAVTKYQEAWNELNPDNQITVDGKFGEQTFRTATVSSNKESESSEETTTEEDTITEKGTTNENLLEKKKDWITPVVAAAQLLPAMYAFGDSPDYMSEHPMASPGAIIPERLSKTHLDRIDMNPEKARNAADFRSMNKFIETSGGGPSNMINKMAAYARKQQGDRDISSQEQRANISIANQEAVMDQQRKVSNVTNALDASKFNVSTQQDVNKFNATMEGKVDEFNRGADAATTDRRLMALDSMTKTFAGMNSDRLQYNAQERMAQAVSGETGVYGREAYKQILIARGLKPGTESFTNAMNAYGASESGTEETTTSTTTTKYDSAGNLLEEPKTKKKKGGFIPTGFRRYS